MQAAADAMNDLRKDDTGISACPHDSTSRSFLSDDANRLFRANFRNHAVHGFQGIQHVIPCIAIRHGENIQLIDNFIFLLEKLIRSYQHIFETIPINNGIHHSLPHLFGSFKNESSKTRTQIGCQNRGRRRECNVHVRIHFLRFVIEHLRSGFIFDVYDAESLERLLLFQIIGFLSGICR